MYSAKQLENKDIVIGTVSNGVLNISDKGILNYKISTISGLNNNTVLAAFEDVDKNIWLALDNGITAINNQSPFRFYKKTSEFLGTVYASAVYKGKLYLGTNQGLFYKSIDSDESFEFVQNTNGQVWGLSIIDDTLFCGHDSGAFIIKNGVANKIYPSTGTWLFKKINDNLIIQGCYNGLFVLEK